MSAVFGFISLALITLILVIYLVNLYHLHTYVLD